MPRSTGTRAAARAWDGLLGWGEFAEGRPALGGGDPLARADVGHVGEDRDALTLTDPDDLVCAGGGQVVCASGQGGRATASGRPGP